MSIHTYTHTYIHVYTYTHTYIQLDIKGSLASLTKSAGSQAGALILDAVFATAQVI